MLVALMIAILGIRLAQGPIRVDSIRSIIISRIEAQLPRTSVSIEHLDLVWFGDARAVGFRFDDLIITDRQNRIIARAGKMEAALAADSLLLAHFAPARLTAEDFFVAASVSKDGKYDLGYEARGKPEEAGGLAGFFYDLTGPEKLGRPASFTRQLYLKNGQLRLIQQDAPLDWTAHVSTIDFAKLHGKMSGHVDLAIAGLGMTEGAPATLKAEASGAVGLKHATISAHIGNLNPSRVFPSVGVTRTIAGINAATNGLARVDYSQKMGFEGASVDLSAARGRIDIGDFRQTFEEARIKARYRSADHTARFDTFRVRSHLLDTDLHGAVLFQPRDRKLNRDLTFRFDFNGPRVSGRLADDFARQTLTQAHFKGAYVPLQRELTIETGTGLLNGAPLQTKGRVYTDPQGEIGADLTAQIKGHFTKEEVFAFWPEDLSPITRSMLIERIKGGDFANADFVLKAEPGDFHHLTNDDLRLDFDFENLTLAIENRLEDATELKGHGTLLGNRFDMDVNGGRLVDVRLTKGRLLVPDFTDHTTYTQISLDSDTDVISVIEAIDPVTDMALSHNGLTRDRLSGAAKAHVEIRFPTFHAINDKNFGLTFKANVTDGAFKQAALGWDMTRGQLIVTGDKLANTLVVEGPARLGPYEGNAKYQTQFDPKSQVIDFNGHFNAAQFGGSPRVPVAIKGHFTIANRKGEGTIDADIFRGKVSWQGKAQVADERPTEMLIEGVTLSKGMEAQGLPIFEHLKREVPTRISLLRSGEIWSGEVDAESLSGDIAYIQGERSRLVYKSVITPDEADELGYGALPMFNEPRHLTVNISLDGASKEALLKLDQMNATLGWAEIPGTDELQRRLSMKVMPDDWYVLGLPKAFFTPKQPVDVTAVWQQTDRLLSGQVGLLDQTIKFEMPLKERDDPQPIVLPNTNVPYELQIRGTVSDAILSALGYSQTPVRIGGNTDFVFSLYNTPGQPAAVLNMDATHANLGVNATDWVKPAGESAQFAVSIDEQGPKGGTNLSRIYGAGPRVGIDGRASFAEDGSLKFADFSKLYLQDFIDVAFKYYAVPEQNTNVMSISGQQLDLRPWLESTRERTRQNSAPAPAAKLADVVDAAANAPASIPATHLVVNLAQLRMTPSDVFNQLNLDLTWDGANGISGGGSGRTTDGEPLTLTLDDQGAYSFFTLRTDNLGSIIQAASGNRNVKGGRTVIDGVYADGQVDASVRGSDIRVKQIPALAQLLTVASLQGLNDTLVGDGILFREFDFPVRYKDGLLFIRNGYAKGEALGISVWGTSDLDSKALDLRGTIIPAYSVNAIFGDVKSNGLGLVGIKYHIGGTSKLPEATVNPLSVVLPGFMKVWFEASRKDALPALDLPGMEDKLDDLRDQNDRLNKPVNNKK
ncbi:DUF3971 domain-containing protein [Asticcacaulis sp. AC466]|uniref:DUF3971 domain-containing protein n=1 Tax=Asticcacaulis sp. AC466 TaxID=1282362 RepID=UPI001F3B56EF|nr:DUF3971 domain-containing protein [Asticcacaulis sp. AC466]